MTRHVRPGHFWTAGQIERSAKAIAGRAAGKPPRRQAPRFPATCHAFASAARGQGVIFESGGRRVGCQAWAPAPEPGTYWYLVKDPAFPGEMRKITFDKAGKVTGIDVTVYNAQGKRAHERDGSECTSGRFTFAEPKFSHRFGCHGCNVAAAERLAGKLVRVVLEGDPSCGPVTRWGTLREVRDEVAVFDGLRDCYGVHDGPGHDGNGIEIKIRDLLELTP